MQSNIVVPPETTIMVPIHHLDLPVGRDFIFEPDSTPLTLYAHWVDSNISHILATNQSSVPYHIPRNRKVGTICEMDYEGCFHIAPEKYDMAARTKPPSWWRKSKNQTSNAPTTSHPKALTPALTEEENDIKIRKSWEAPTVTQEGRWNTMPNDDIRDPKTQVAATSQQHQPTVGYHIQNLETPTGSVAGTSAQDRNTGVNRDVYKHPPRGHGRTTSSQCQTITDHLDRPIHSSSNMERWMTSPDDPTFGYPESTDESRVNQKEVTISPKAFSDHHQLYLLTTATSTPPATISQSSISNQYRPNTRVPVTT